MKSHTTREESRQIADLNGDIMVARTLVRTCLADNTSELDSVSEMARHCQLLCSRAKLSPIQAHIADLSAWLSALVPHNEAVARDLSAKHELDEVVFGDPSGNPRTEDDIFSLARTYQELKKKDPSLGDDHVMARRALEREWVQTEQQQSLARKFANVLRDQEFLTHSHAAAGHILIVDPEEIVAPVLSSPLSDRGYDIKVLDNVHSVLEALKESQPDIILAEMDMPLISGLDLCEELKKDPKTSAIPFVIMSAKRGKAPARNALRKGANDFLQKPVDLEMLFLKLGNLIPEERVEAGRSASGVTGSLADMPFTDMIQIVCAGGKNMVIALSHEDTEGEIAIIDGNIVHAQVGSKEGDEAFYALMTWKQGDFTTRGCDDYPKKTVQNSLMSLLMEGARLADESADDSPQTP